MGKSLKQWLQRPLFVYLFCLFFLFYKTALCFPTFRLSTFLLFSSALFVINYSLTWLITKKLSKLGLSWLLIWWVFFLFLDSIHNYVMECTNINFARFRYLFPATLLVGFCYAMVKNKIKAKIGLKKVLSLNYYLNIFMLILSASTLLSGVFLYQHEAAHQRYLLNRKLPPLNTRNDIVWILLDEYAAPSSLKSQFQFHDLLTDSLKSKGFFVADSLRTRNDTTLYSINSLFNLDDSLKVSNYMYAARYLNNSSWVKQLKQSGYRFISFDFLDVAHQPKLCELHIFPDNYTDQLLSGSIFSHYNDFFNERMRLFDNYNQQVINQLSAQFYKKTPSPSFIWAHLLMPHPPFYRDAAGNFNSVIIADIVNAPPETVKKQYVSYLLYANTVVLKILRNIPDWKHKTIIISGDHGARMIIPQTDPRRKRTFAAIYFPDMNYKQLSNIKYLQQIPFYLR